ncbi:MAG: alpha/beta hydrolase [Myxococcota bacterium]
MVAKTLMKGGSKLRRKAGAVVLENFFKGLSTVAQVSPLNQPQKHGVELITDLPYAATGRREHLLDVYVPEHASEDEPLPVAIYVHGGGFCILSKDTHSGMALQFARKNFVVFNINYRLAPQHPYPAALEDVCDAYRWVLDNAERFGGDPSRILLAGESAGANLVTSLTLAAHYERPEPWADRVFQTGQTPTAVAPACGIFQVSDVDRLWRRRELSWFVRDRLHEISTAYLPGGGDPDDPAYDLADPLVFLERGEAPDRQLPPFFLPVGTRDVLLDDTRRMREALDRLSTSARQEIYPGEIHAFHALAWREQARQCWRHHYEFMDMHIPGEAP